MLLLLRLLMLLVQGHCCRTAAATKAALLGPDPNVASVTIARMNTGGAGV